MAFEKLSPEILRRHKGVSFTGITTAFFCYDDQGRIFLSKRSKNARDEHGRWDAGEGGLKHGQAIEQNMRRELKEEYNVEPLKVDFIGYMDMFRKTAEGIDNHWLAMDFAVKVDPAKIKINEPDMVDGSGWFTLDNLPSPMHSQMDAFMAKHGEQLRKIIKKNSA